MVRRSLLALVVAVGCSPKGREAGVRFLGTPPPGAFAEDTREVVETCPACLKPVDRYAVQCACGARLHHPVRAVCGFCRGTKACALCAVFETSGLCRFCGGEGRRRGAPVCFGCRGSGACAACGGSAVCDACGGSGSVELPWARPAPRTAARPAGKSLTDSLEEH